MRFTFIVIQSCDQLAHFFHFADLRFVEQWIMGSMKTGGFGGISTHFWAPQKTGWIQNWAYIPLMVFISFPNNLSIFLRLEQSFPKYFKVSIKLNKQSKMTCCIFLCCPHRFIWIIVYLQIWLAIRKRMDIFSVCRIVIFNENEFNTRLSSGHFSCVWYFEVRFRKYRRTFFININPSDFGQLISTAHNSSQFLIYFTCRSSSYLLPSRTRTFRI